MTSAPRRFLTALTLLATLVSGAADGGEAGRRDPIEGWDWVAAGKAGPWYAATRSSGSFRRAEGEALVAGGHLVTIDDEAESRFLLETFGALADADVRGDEQSALWVGLGRRRAEQPLTWTSGAALTHTSWAAGHPMASLAEPSAAALLVGGEDAGRWIEISDTEVAHIGIIELDFDPTVDPLAVSGRTRLRDLEKLRKAREEFFEAADRDPDEALLAALGAELAALRAEKLAIIHATPLPSSDETRAASDAVQTWIDRKFGEWVEDQRRRGKALKTLEKAYTKVVAEEPYAMGLEALRTELFLALLDRERSGREAELRQLNRRIAARTGLDAERLAIVTRTNEHRRVMGLELLELDGRATYAAQIHAEDMQALGFFAHESPVPGRSSPRDRLQEAGFVGGSGENLHMGNRARFEPVDAWIGSPGHHMVMLIGQYDIIGPGSAGDYSVEVFGTRR